MEWAELSLYALPNIETDASTMGWGVGGKELGELGIGQLHINSLELLGATQCFTKEQNNLSILLIMDNTSTISNINGLGGTVFP